MTLKESSHIRSYVLRQGKMTPAQREAYESLKSEYVVPLFEDKRLSLPDLFPGLGRFVLEIGFGMGRATARIAEDNPDIGYLGVEVHTPGVGKLLWEIREKSLANIRIVHGDVVPLLRSMLEDDSLDGVHIFFPDPWPKKRHWKRRLVNPEFLGLLVPKMRTGGYLSIVTDWKDYAEHIVSAVSAVEDLECLPRACFPRIAWRPETAFEKKGRDAGRDIEEMFFRKR